MTDQSATGRERHKKVDLPGNAEGEFWLQSLGDKIQAHTTHKSRHGSGSGSGGGWLRCSQHGCLGEALSEGACIVHSDAQVRQAHLVRTAHLKESLSLKGITLSQRLWDEIVASPVFVDGTPCVPLSFVGAEISAAIRISHKNLQHHLDLTGASIFAPMELRECTFGQGLSARHGFFNSGPLNCPGSKFLQDVDISYSRAQQVSLGFESCTFQGQFIADGTDATVQLARSIFARGISFKHAKASIILTESRVSGPIDLSYSECAGVHGQLLHADTANQLGPFKTGFLNLSGANFQSRVRIEVATGDINLSNANLRGGGLIDVDAKSVQLSQVSLGGPLRVSGKPHTERLTEIRGLMNSDAGQITFARVDLSKCSFYGAHGLGSMELESTVAFPKSPWWAGRRRFIVDELTWRMGASRLHRIGWNFEGFHVGTELPVRSRGEQEKILLPPVDAAQVASLYRGIRRSLESKSDMPGAAMFYYGEMEMRRWSAPFLERVLLTLYWLVSGYGMRATRAFVSWLALIALGSQLMRFDGFATDSYSMIRGLLFATRATLPGVPSLETLTPTGQAIEVGLRIFGPVLVALFLIAVRGKLMRKPSD